MGLAFLIALLGTTSVHALDEDDFLDRGREVRTDGQTVVWGTAQLNIFMASVADGDVRPVTEIDGRQSYPAVSGDVVVWTQGDQPGGQIGNDLSVMGTTINSDQEPFTIHAFTFDDSRIAGPAIDGDVVAWIDRSQGVMARNISTMDDAVVLAEFEGNQGRGGISIDGTQVVWGEFYSNSSTWKVLTVDVLDGGATAPQVLYESEARFGLRRVDISDGRVVFNNENDEILMIDLASGEQKHLGSNSEWPVIDGDFVFWSSYSHSTVDEHRWDLIGYDLRTDSRFPIVERGTNFPQAASNGVLVWLRGDPHSQDDRVRVNNVSDLLPTAPRPEPEDDNPNRIFFPETSHNLVFGFKTFWERSGGLPVFGFPLTEEFEERNPDTGDFHTVQYFERQRYEYHPEHAGTVYEVLLGRLGVTDAAQRGLLDDPAFAPDSPDGFSDDCVFFEVTSQAVCGDFLDYWQSHGLDFGDDGVSFRESLALFGYPISAEFEDPDTGLITQYFERARFEYHPDNPTEHQVLLGRLGADLLEQRDW